jgi:hypothetical protein
MQTGDKVVIGGRTMLRPGFSLVGFTGTVVESAANAPAGTLTIKIDWQEAGYEDGTNLPEMVNVPTIHLSAPEPVETEPPKRPVLKLV